MAALLRQSTYSRLAGYEDTNDAERLAVDPAMRWVVGARANCQATIIIPCQRQLEVPMTMMVLSSAWAAAVERSETAAAHAAGRNVRPLWGFYFEAAAGVSAGAAAAFDFLACSTR